MHIRFTEIGGSGYLNSKVVALHVECFKLLVNHVSYK